MSRRRKDRKKRRTGIEDAPVSDAVSSDEDTAEDSAAESSTLPFEADEVPDRGTRTPDRQREGQSAMTEKPGTSMEKTGWFYQNRENLLLGILVLYVLLLGLGTAGELFEIEWVLNLPIFK